MMVAVLYYLRMTPFYVAAAFDRRARQDFLRRLAGRSRRAVPVEGYHKGPALARFWR